MEGLQSGTVVGLSTGLGEHSRKEECRGILTGQGQLADSEVLLSFKSISVFSASSLHGPLYSALAVPQGDSRGNTTASFLTFRQNLLKLLRDIIERVKYLMVDFSVGVKEIKMYLTP